MVDGCGKWGKPGWTHWKLQYLWLPEGLKDKRAEIISDFKTALLACKDGGFFSVNTEYNVVLDVAEAAQ